MFVSFDDFYFLSPAAGPRKITKPRAPELRRAQAPTTAPASTKQQNAQDKPVMLILRLSCGGFSMGLKVSGGGLGSSPRKNGVQVCSTNFGGLVKLSTVAEFKGTRESVPAREEFCLFWQMEPWIL